MVSYHIIIFYANKLATQQLLLSSNKFSYYNITTAVQLFIYCVAFEYEHNAKLDTY